MVKTSHSKVILLMQGPKEIPLQPAAKLHLLFDSKATVASVKSCSAFPTAFVLGTSLLP